MKDIRYALRQFVNAPIFTITAVLTLALGIGATTAIFTLVHAVLLNSLPVTKPSELYRVGDVENCCVNGGLQDNWSLFSYDKYKMFRDNTPGFVELAAFQAGHDLIGVRRSGSREAGAFDAKRIRFRKLLRHVWHWPVCRPGHNPRRRSQRRASGHGDQLSGVATAVRRRSLDCRRLDNFERPAVHRGRHRAGRVFW